MKNAPVRKPLRVMDDPKLDRIFTEAYRQTMNEVATVERGRNLSDHIDAYAELFERDLASRDLSSSERKEFVEAFKSYIRDADARREADDRRRRRRTRALSITVAAVLALAALGFVAKAQPFTSLNSVRGRLDSAVVEVDKGYGEYSKTFYKTLRRYERKLGTAEAEAYRGSMHAELDEHFNALLAKVTSGDMVYTDDAKEWAGYYPSPEERKAKREAVDNAFQTALGKKVGESLETVTKETKDFLKRAFDFVKTEIDKRR